ncbi:MAG: isoprenylcysteine carboxylmethyltransferase family protein [Bacteroidota bacterium]|nr:isoprenylcysteine carboxylmethyltransferase family protein [Bacteroidota bacterium]MDP4232090.1 isoprenylcysteine carboxylmethyltransferase family protein [Bacteroidota bacterium]MDP4241203.1 isoprenylcysteine carboxylmethyltransferase family protein [Bacteroidota bacterium]MDP4286595.1 isoprenylcysteine carboxylmethyltransferase family protein [Bacteroidota bacterium]
MSLHSWLHNERGEWYVLLQVLLMAMVFVAHRIDAPERHLVEIRLDAPYLLGAVLAIAGVTIALLGVGALGRSLSPYPRPKAEAELHERGVYGIVRHPIYSGIVLWSLGWSVMYLSLATLAAALVLFAFFDIKARREERWLEQKFTGYTAYKQRVRKLIPFVY